MGKYTTDSNFKLTNILFHVSIIISLIQYMICPWWIMDSMNCSFIFIVISICSCAVLAREDGFLSCLVPTTAQYVKSKKQYPFSSRLSVLSSYRLVCGKCVSKVSITVSDIQSGQHLHDVLVDCQITLSADDLPSDHPVKLVRGRKNSSDACIPCIDFITSGGTATSHQQQVK